MPVQDIWRQVPIRVQISGISARRKVLLMSPLMLASLRAPWRCFTLLPQDLLKKFQCSTINGRAVQEHHRCATLGAALLTSFLTSSPLASWRGS
jgi:hypothetical protein